MRKRPSYNGIEEVVKIPTTCSSCNNKIQDGETVMYECEINYLICNKCTQKNHGGPNVGYYTSIEDFQDDMTMTVHKDKSSMDYID